MPRSPRLSRRAFLYTALGLGGGLALSGPLGWLYATRVEPDWLEVEHVRVSLPRLPKAFHGLTIAQFSDLHLGPFIGAKEVRAAVDAALQLAPDVIVVTGDFVSQLSHGEAEIIVEELSRLAAPEGVFAILGNHDWWTNSAVVSEAVERAGLMLLRNANIGLSRNGETLYLAGVDDVWEEQADLPLALTGVPADAPAILLAHEPDYADIVTEESRVILQLSGHSHGGQVQIPFHGPLALPYLGQKYPVGLRQVGDLWLYTNRGIGVVSPPVRFNCRPEVTLFTLVAEG
jgi:uncharacterized protein